MTDFIERLRALPHYQKHLIVWGGSIVIFLGISWIWVGQIGNQLASLTPPGTVIAQEESEEEESTSYVIRIQELFDSAKKGTASLFSLFQGENEEEDTQSPIREGNELNEFLNQKGFEPFPE